MNLLILIYVMCIDVCSYSLILSYCVFVYLSKYKMFGVVFRSFLFIFVMTGRMKLRLLKEVA